MNAIKLLETQHDEVEALFKKIEDADKPDRKQSLFNELADSLAAHAKIEETIFYPAVMAKQTKDMLLESAEEHLQIKRVLADLLKLDPGVEEFGAKLKVMKEEVEHHAREEEEKKLFPKVKKLLSSDELEALGSEMTRRFEELLATQPRRDVPKETARAAKL